MPEKPGTPQVLWKEVQENESQHSAKRCSNWAFFPSLSWEILQNTLTLQPLEMLQRQPLVRAIPEHVHQRRNSPRVLSQRLLVHTEHRIAQSWSFSSTAILAVFWRREREIPRQKIFWTRTGAKRTALLFQFISIQIHREARLKRKHYARSANIRALRRAKVNSLFVWNVPSQNKSNAADSPTTPAQPAQRPPVPSPKHVQIKVMNARSCNPQHLFQWPSPGALLRALTQGQPQTLDQSSDRNNCRHAASSSAPLPGEHSPCPPPASRYPTYFFPLPS